MSAYYTEWASHNPIAVVNRQTGVRYWFDYLNDDSKEEALAFDWYDIHRRRFIEHSPQRLRSFRMNRKYLRA